MKRVATLYAPADLGAAGTKVIDLNLREQISRITMKWKVVNVTVSVMLAPVLECISKIELVDGSEVIASLTGKEAQALNYYDRKIMPFNAASLTVGGIFEAEFALDFGRFLYDPEYALDPTRYKNPQLKITWDEDACNTSAVVNEFSAYAHVDDSPGGPPVGFLLSQEINAYAMGASAHEYVNLPTDGDIRRILIQAESTDHDPVALLNTIKVEAENGKAIPFEMTAADLDKIIGQYPRVVEPMTLDAAVTAKTIYSNLSKDLAIAVDYGAEAFITAQSKFAAATYAGAKIALAASVDIKAATALISGRLPHNTLPLDFGDPMNPASWFKAGDYANLRADILASSDADSGDTTRVVVQRVKV